MKVALADDHGIFRSSFSRALEDLGVSVEISVSSGSALLAAIAAQPVDVVVIDVNMPPTGSGEGLRVARELKEKYSSMAVLLLSAETATRPAIGLLQDFDSGIGYLRKDEVSDAEELLVSLRRLQHGEQVIGASIVNRLLRASRHDEALESLSAQEAVVLRLMAEGYSNVGIARRLHLADRTVEDYVSRIFTKLDISGEAGAKDSNKRVLAVLTWLRLTMSS